MRQLQKTCCKKRTRSDSQFAMFTGAGLVDK